MVGTLHMELHLTYQQVSSFMKTVPPPYLPQEGPKVLNTSDFSWK